MQLGSLFRKLLLSRLWVERLQRGRT